MIRWLLALAFLLAALTVIEAVTAGGLSVCIDGSCHTLKVGKLP